MENLNLQGMQNHRAPESLGNLSALIMDDSEIAIDNAAIHGKAKVERGVSYVKTREELVHPQRFVVIWLSLKKAAVGQGIFGMGASVFLIDRESGSCYKDLADQVNKMEVAIKGRVDLQELSVEERQRLEAFLKEKFPDVYENSPQETKDAFAG